MTDDSERTQPDETVTRLRALLEVRGWSGRQLGREAGIGEEHAVKLLERGLGRAGSATVLKVAKALGVHMRWLVAGEGPRDVDSNAREDRYPERAKAADFADGRFDSRAIGQVVDANDLSAEYRTREQWLAMIQRIHDELALEDAHPELREARLAKDRAETERQLKALETRRAASGAPSFEEIERVAREKKRAQIEKEQERKRKK